ncbi:hypothetical protein DY000_02039327 [Brassica cretica]|uniref:Uncharacterized protein n=1 Tax=Brassica cretica TaxID=69181 RepID=A0ABQ7BIS8_BRACR|nr:hypothetical protein DY000_02039327 [Brassica cretica]
MTPGCHMTCNSLPYLPKRKKYQTGSKALKEKRWRIDTTSIPNQPQSDQKRAMRIESA